MQRRLLSFPNYDKLSPGDERMMRKKLQGSILLLLGDLAGKSLLSPIVLPIGAITSFLGGPLFLWMLFRGRESL